MHPAPARTPIHLPLLGGLAISAAVSLAWTGVTTLTLLLKPEFLPEVNRLGFFARNFVTDLVAITTLWLCVFALHRRVHVQGRWRWWMLAAVALVAGLLSIAAASQVGRLWSDRHEFRAEYLPFFLMRQGTLALLLVGLLEFRRRADEATAALHETTLRQAALQAELSAARYTLLQAQIEPHFLFNSLANVRRLLRTDPPAAQALLHALRRYLEEALPLLREQHSTLGREAELVAAYLAVHQVRMGPRLAAQVQVPEALRGQELPPMMLLTLVENAIKHGLAPLVEGGAIRVQAAADAGTLVLTVADTGRGMGESVGHGTGLANLRARLQARYGTRARLSLRLNEPRGVVAEVSLPLATAPEARA